MPDFIHLHNHSYYSLLDGLSSIEALVKCAKDLKYKSLALTDHGTCAGLYQFQAVCGEEGIKPILGMEAYITDNHTVKEKGTNLHHLVLLAKNKVGYKNLIYLSSFGYLQGFYYRPRIDLNILEKHKEGLIVSSACASGEIPYMLLHDNEEGACKIANKYREIFGDDFYIEIMTHTYEFDKEQEAKEKKVASALYKLSRKLGIKGICTSDTHYARKEDWEAQDVLLSIQTLNSIKNPDRLTFGSKDFYLKPFEEMVEIYSKAPSLLLNTVEIGEKIENELISASEDLLPNFELPEGFKDEESYLRELVKTGMEQKKLTDKDEYNKRIKYEMEVILRCNYTKYFLILWDIINFAKTNNIRVGVGRGSAVGSLVLYVLGVTKLDPLTYDLIFERFLNPDRVSPPDVDVDFDHSRRDEIYNYVVRKYGTDYCSQIGTYNRFKARATLRSTAKALDIGKDWEEFQKAKEKDPKIKNTTKHSLNLADYIAKQIPFKSKNIEEALRQSSQFRASVQKYPKLIECCRRIEDTVSSAGVHPAGIIVCKDPIIEKVPLRVSKDVVCSQYEGEEVEKLGLLKFDLLAIKTLTLIENTLKLIEERHGDKIDIDNLVPNDKKIFEMYNGIGKKSTHGLFQFESPGMVKLLKNLRVDSFEDLVVAVALYRPGPLGSGLHESYCQFKHGRKKIEYLHPKMGEVLKDTYGIMIFQENIMRVAQELAGFSGGQSDTLRKAVGKKMPELLKEQKELFVKGCIKNGIKQSIAEEIFKQIDYFSGYGFNKSHATSYAYISYQMAYLKTYYPLEFMCNLLTGEINNNDKNEKLNEYMTVGADNGIVCLRTDINKSGLVFKIEKGINKKGEEYEFLRIPFTVLKGVGAKAVNNIVENQPYKDLEDFVKKVDARVVNISVFKTLIDSHCMEVAWNVKSERLSNAYAEIKKRVDKDKKNVKKQQEKMQKLGTESLFDEFDYSGEGLKF